MNPNSANPTLDPKLKETFDRVMGTQVTTSQMPSAQSAPPPAPQANPDNIYQQPQSSLAPALENKQPEKTVIKIQPETAPASSSSLTPEAMQTSTGAGGSKIVLGAFIGLGVLFFALYAFFWMRVFNIALPF